MATPACSSPSSEPVSVAAVARGLLAHPWRTLVIGWNWKAGLLAGLFRLIVFVIAGVPRTPMAWAGVLLQLAARVILGGCWGSLTQAFRFAEPAWLAGSLLVLFVPIGLHAVEYAFLRAGHATHIRAGMIVSVSMSAASFLLNWMLMRRGLLLTGEGTESLAADFRRLPLALADFCLAGPRLLFRFLWGCFARA
jgi:hypothetical protein